MKISNIKKNLGEFLLDIESLKIPEGKIYGIIGSNGCGKTTLMKVIAGLLKPDSGHIDFEGLTPRDITMVFRKPYLIHDTVIKNLLYPLTVRKLAPDEAQIEEYLELAGLKSHKDQYAPGLSGGQQQKLALIRAHIFSPKLIIIDEGFSNLDIKSTGAFEQFILNRRPPEKTTYIICAHQLSQIRRLCGYIFFMDNGKVEEEGPTDEILLNPKNDRLKKYLQYESSLVPETQEEARNEVYDGISDS